MVCAKVRSLSDLSRRVSGCEEEEEGGQMWLEHLINLCRILGGYMEPCVFTHTCEQAGDFKKN